jgi:hypothetical protein
MLKAILEEPEIERCRSLKRVFCGGEVLPAELQEHVFAAWQDVELQNTYGPTEASIDVTFWVCRRENESGSKWQRVSIGRPIANTQIYILDSHLQPVPVGVPGELHIGGAGLARGYLNRPDLAAEKFIPNPFSNEPGARLYKTGDWTRYLPDGRIEFLGRIDQQVKIRGFRIELGEIETVLSQHPMIQQIVVVAHEELDYPKSGTCSEPGRSIQNPESSEKRLVAYAVLKSGQTLDATAARSFLKDKLPEYMVPSAFVFLDSLPVTFSGKVNRKALPAPDHGRPDLQATYVAPRNPVEEVMAAIWAEALRLEQVGMYDNFFDLGGHSLLAVRVVSQIQSVLRVDIALRTLFEQPTVAGLTAAILNDPLTRKKIDRTAELTLKLSHLSTDQVDDLLSKEYSSVGRTGK